MRKRRLWKRWMPSRLNQSTFSRNAKHQDWTVSGEGEGRHWIIEGGHSRSIFSWVAASYLLRAFLRNVIYLIYSVVMLCHQGFSSSSLMTFLPALSFVRGPPLLPWADWLSQTDMQWISAQEKVGIQHISIVCVTEKQDFSKVVFLLYCLNYAKKWPTALRSSLFDKACTFTLKNTRCPCQSITFLHLFIIDAWHDKDTCIDQRNYSWFGYL